MDESTTPSAGPLGYHGDLCRLFNRGIGGSIRLAQGITPFATVALRAGSHQEGSEVKGIAFKYRYPGRSTPPSSTTRLEAEKEQQITRGPVSPVISLESILGVEPRVNYTLRGALADGKVLSCITSECFSKKPANNGFAIRLQGGNANTKKTRDKFFTDCEARADSNSAGPIAVSYGATAGRAGLALGGALSRFARRNDGSELDVFCRYPPRFECSLKQPNDGSSWWPGLLPLRWKAGGLLGVKSLGLAIGAMDDFYTPDWWKHAELSVTGRLGTTNVPGRRRSEDSSSASESSRRPLWRAGEWGLLVAREKESSSFGACACFSRELAPNWLSSSSIDGSIRVKVLSTINTTESCLSLSYIRRKRKTTELDDDDSGKKEGATSFSSFSPNDSSDDRTSCFGITFWTKPFGARDPYPLRLAFTVMSGPETGRFV